MDIGVYSALCYFADKEGICWPSCKSIAEKAKVSEATVRRALKLLVKEGYLTIETRLDSFGRNTSNIYHLNLNKLNDTLPHTTDTLPCQNDSLPSKDSNDEKYSKDKELELSFKKYMGDTLHPTTDTLPLTTDTLPPVCDRQKNIQRSISKEEESKEEKKNTMCANEKNSRTARPRFVKPTVEEVRAYCNERHNMVDANQFWDFYESKGWMVGRNPMKDWKAAVRGQWEKRKFGNETREESDQWKHVTEEERRKIVAKHTHGGERDYSAILGEFKALERERSKLRGQA